MVLFTAARADTAFANAGALSILAVSRAGEGCGAGEGCPNTGALSSTTGALAIAALLVVHPTTTFAACVATPQPLPSPLAAVASSTGSREGRGQILPGDPRHGRAGIWMGGTAAESARASGRWVRQLLPWNMGL